MSKADHLRLRDVRSAFRLVGEVIELGADPHDWWTHLLEGLRGLTGAAAGIGGELNGLFFLDRDIRVLGNFFAGLDDDAVNRFRHFMVHEKWKTIDEGGQWYYRLRGNGASIAVRSQEQMMASRRWRRSEMFNDYFRPSHIDDRLYSFCQAPDGRSHGGALWNGITMFRGLGERPFTARERRLLRLVHGELRPLVGTRVASLGKSALRPLSPRLRQTLNLLLSGFSEKQIAGRCGLATSTINEYVAALYQRYGVSSRAELMARFLRWRDLRRSDNASPHTTDNRGPDSVSHDP